MGEPDHLAAGADNARRTYLTCPARPCAGGLTPAHEPWVTVPHLAPHLLGRIAKELSTDWQALYAHPVYFLVLPAARKRCFLTIRKREERGI